MKSILKFCIEPNFNKFMEINKVDRKFMYQVSLFCTENNKGNIRLAEKIIDYDYLSKMNDTNIRDIKSIMLLLKLLEQISYKINLDSFITTATINFKSKETMEINYELYPSLKKIYTVDEKLRDFIPREFNLYKEEFKSYIIELIYSKKLEVKDILISYSNSKEKIIFYDTNIGVIWDSTDDCIECINFFKKHNIKLDKNYNITKDTVRKGYLKFHPDKGGKKKEFVSFKNCLKPINEDKCVDNIKFFNEDFIKA